MAPSIAIEYARQPPADPAPSRTGRRVPAGDGSATALAEPVAPSAVIIAFSDVPAIPRAEPGAGGRTRPTTMPLGEPLSPQAVDLLLAVTASDSSDETSDGEFPLYASGDDDVAGDEITLSAVDRALAGLDADL